MSPWSVRLGNEETYEPDLGFSSSLLHKCAPINDQPVLLVQDAVHLERQVYCKAGEWFAVCAKETRNREEARERGGFLRFLHELPTSCTELSIEGVKFISMEELSALCSSIGSPLCIISALHIGAFTNVKTVNTDDDRAQQHILLKDALFKNTSLTHLSVHISDASLITSAEECLIPALTRPTPRASIKSLNLVTRYYDYRCPLFDPSTIVEGLACNTISLKKLFLCRLPFYGEHLFTMLRSNTSLQCLTVARMRLDGQDVKMLFASLEHNVHLTSLSLYGCDGSDWPNASFVLDSLRANGIVSSLDLRDTPLMGESEAVIEAQLARNKQRAEQLRLEGSVLVPPKTVRLFLCGLPFSGKTTLSRSLVKWNTKDCCQDRICLRPCAPAIMPGRTRGIEVSNLEKDGVTVSLWDMAGQEHYYAFHDHMFPNLSDDATPSIFVFVWNPVQLDKETNKEIRDDGGANRSKTPDMFEDEFRYWLRFIASKTLESLKFKPCLFVAITRADLLQIPATTLIRSGFTRCQKDFEARVQFGMDGVFEINARDPCDAEDLGLRIFQRATSILKEKPLAYQACNRARIELSELVLAKRLAPLITKEEFFYVCESHLRIDDKEMQEAVGLSLNESGDLIYFKELELVVTDVRWFCHELMGNLLYSCHMNLKQHQHRGFFPLEFLEAFLELKANYTPSTRSCASHLKTYITIFTKQPPIISKIKGKGLPPIKSKIINGRDLVKLLIGLQLACQQGDGDHLQVFIPASLCGESGRQVDPRGYLLGSEDDENMQTFLGRRLKCKDPICTFFTPAIFTSLQTAFHDIFKELIILDEDIIAFSQSGVKVLIEFCKHVGQDHFIDVLIHSRLDLDNTIAWACEEVLDRMESICARPRGIQGVELVRQVIRPRSVKECILMEDRRCAAVSVEELQKDLRHALEKRGIRQPNCLNTVFHNWNPGSGSDRVVDLLGNMETLEVVKQYTQSFMWDVENVLGINIEEELVCSTSTEPQHRLFSSTNSGKERELIYHEVREARRDIEKVQEEISKVVAEVQKISDVVLPQIRQKVQELLTFAKDGEAGKLPRLFVVTKDDAMVRRIVGAMIPGLENVRLELLCEHRARPHLVPEQCGIRFSTLEDGILKQGLPYINMFLKLVSMAVKVGAQVTTGLGNAIPDLSHLLATILDPTGSQSLQIHVDSQAPNASRINFQDSQRWLFRVLSEHDCITSLRIHEVFGLQRVRYSNSQVAWLCDKHCSEGELCL